MLSISFIELIGIGWHFPFPSSVELVLALSSHHGTAWAGSMVGFRRHSCISIEPQDPLLQCGNGGYLAP